MSTKPLFYPRVTFSRLDVPPQAGGQSIYSGTCQDTIVGQIQKAILNEFKNRCLDIRYGLPPVLKCLSRAEMVDAGFCEYSV